MIDYQLALMTGVDIPIPELQMVMHQPTIKEISMIGEEIFLTGIQFICIDKGKWGEMTAELSNFELFINLMNDTRMADKKQIVLQTMDLLFPNIQTYFTPRSILLNKGDTTVIIDESNFELFQTLLTDTFGLKENDGVSYNPSDEKASKIAQKLLAARKKVAKQKMMREGGASGGSIFSQYLSILSVGLTMNLKDLLELTVYQLKDLVERYHLYLSWDLDIRTRLAGGTPDSQTEDWMKKIH